MGKREEIRALAAELINRHPEQDLVRLKKILTAALREVNRQLAADEIQLELPLDEVAAQ